MNWKLFTKRILVVLLGLLVVGVVIIAGIIIWDSIFPSQQVIDFTNVTFPGPDGQDLYGYLVQPPMSNDQAAPAILMVHEFFGINQETIDKANLLAEQGYTVLAVDAYRGKTTQLIPRAIFLVVSTPRNQIQADLAAGYKFLSSQPNVQADHVGTIGFCFGGTQVMHFATLNSGVAATVILYGSGPITDPDALGVMAENGPVLGIYGAEDGQIPISEVKAFEQAMQSNGVENTVTIYPGVGHAFVNTETLQEPGSQAQQAWEQLIAFFAETLR